MNKTTNIFIYIFLYCSSLFISCDEEFDDTIINDDTEQNVTETSQNIRNVELVKTLAHNFIKSSNNKTRASNLQQIKDVDVFILKENSIKKNRSYNEIDSKIDTFMYAVNFTDGESIIVSADKRIPPILAFFENSNFYFNDLEKKENCGLQYLMEVMTENLLSYIEKEEKKNIKYIGKATRNTWLELQNEENSDLWKLSSYVNPKVKVEWNQGSPFNNYTPYYSGNNHSAVGCVALAIGQAMTSLKPYNQYKGLVLNWNNIERIQKSSDMYNNPEQADVIAKYLYYIGSSIGTSYGESSSANTGNALFVTSKDFKYNYTGLSTNTPSDIKRFLHKVPNNIILMRGNAVKKKTWIFFNEYQEGHCFIIDGYKDYDFVDYINSNDPYYCGYTNYTIFHINLGWGSAYNGYFLGSFASIYREWEKSHIDEEPDYPAMYTYYNSETNLFWKDDSYKEYKYKMKLYGLWINTSL